MHIPKWWKTFVQKWVRVILPSFFFILEQIYLPEESVSQDLLFSPLSTPDYFFFFYPVTFFQLWFKSIRAINIAINKIFLIKKFFFFFTHVLNLQIQAPKTLHPLSWIIIQCIVSSSRSNSYNIILFENNIP